MSSGPSRLSYLIVGHRAKVDMRTRRDRVHLQNLAWTEQMDALVDTYLSWNSSGYSGSESVPAGHHIKIQAFDFFGESNCLTSCMFC